AVWVTAIRELGRKPFVPFGLTGSRPLYHVPPSAPVVEDRRSNTWGAPCGLVWPKVATTSASGAGSVRAAMDAALTVPISMSGQVSTGGVTDWVADGAWLGVGMNAENVGAGELPELEGPATEGVAPEGGEAAGGNAGQAAPPAGRLARAA